MTVTRAAIYARISADPFGHAVGVTDQATQCRQLADRHSWVVTGPACTCDDCKKYDVPPDVYCDNDITASGKKVRPHYERLLADIRSGRVDRVVVLHTDRLHRSPVELEQYINICEPHGVETHTIQAGNVDLSTANGRMVARMFGAMARGELEHMMERQQNAKRRNRDAGLRQAGWAPFGYALDERDARGRQIPGVSRGLVVVPEQAALIRSGYADLLAGVSLAAITRKWNATTIRTTVRPTKNGGTYGGLDWSVPSVRQVLLRAANAGLIEHEDRRGGRPHVYATGRILDGQIAKWEPIVSEDVWRSARAILRDPKRRTSPGSAPRYLLVNVLVCFKCEADGQRSRFRTNKHVASNGAVQRYYTCRGTHVSRNVEMLDEYITEIAVERMSRPDMRKILSASKAADLPALEARKQAIDAELLDIRESVFPVRHKNEMARPLVAELDAIEGKISDALHGALVPGLADPRADPEDVWAGMTLEQKKAVLAKMLRVRLRKAKWLGKPADWEAGQHYMFDYDSVDILPPDTT